MQMGDFRGGSDDVGCYVPENVEFFSCQVCRRDPGFGGVTSGEGLVEDGGSFEEKAAGPAGWKCKDLGQFTSVWQRSGPGHAD